MYDTTWSTPVYFFSTANYFAVDNFSLTMAIFIHFQSQQVGISVHVFPCSNAHRVAF